MADSTASSAPSASSSSTSFGADIPAKTQQPGMATDTRQGPAHDTKPPRLMPLPYEILHEIALYLLPKPVYREEYGIDWKVPQPADMRSLSQFNRSCSAAYHATLDLLWRDVTVSAGFNWKAIRPDCLALIRQVIIHHRTPQDRFGPSFTHGAPPDHAHHATITWRETSRANKPPSNLPKIDIRISPTCSEPLRYTYHRKWPNGLIKAEITSPSHVISIPGLHGRPLHGNIRSVCAIRFTEVQAELAIPVVKLSDGPASGQLRLIWSTSDTRSKEDLCAVLADQISLFSSSNVAESRWIRYEISFVGRRRSCGFSESDLSTLKSAWAGLTRKRHSPSLIYDFDAPEITQPGRTLKMDVHYRLQFGR